MNVYRVYRRSTFSCFFCLFSDFGEIDVKYWIFFNQTHLWPRPGWSYGFYIGGARHTEPKYLGRAKHMYFPILPLFPNYWGVSWPPCPPPITTPLHLTVQRFIQNQKLMSVSNAQFKSCFKQDSLYINKL